MKTKLHALLIFSTLATLSAIPAETLEKEFLSPPDSARPGVYWYFMDGNQDRKEMVADLHAMKSAGIGSVLFLEVDLGMARGPVSFMSEPWQDNVAHAFVEAGKLGMEVVLGTGPGWAGSGGSWVAAADSMQHLVGSSLKVSGPGVLNQVLPPPPPHKANHFAGMTPDHVAKRNAWFQDVAVIAFPTPAGGTTTIDNVDMKTLKDVQPFSIKMAKAPFVMPQVSYPEPDTSHIIDANRVVDLTSLLKPDGSIKWDIPAGEWTVMRFVARSTGQTTRPAPRAGHGFENNKFDKASYQRHWDNYQQKLLDKVLAKGGPLQKGKGLTTIHLDSWEMSSQNWTSTFRKEFQQRRGYDPQPFYPAFMGLVVGGMEKTERFLWDMRKTSQELVLEQHAGAIKQLAHKHGLLYSNEPYDMNPAGDIDLGSVADIPMCEFWYTPHDTQYSCIEAASISHTMGQQIVKAESFTSSGDAFANHPANMKNQTDWAFAIGINGIMFHTYQHQALGDTEKPGMTMGPYGIQWHRNQTLWNYLAPYHEYITRCSHLLSQGEAVADILYLTAEGAPSIFEAPVDAVEGAAKMRDKRGYSFDAVSPRILSIRAVVENGRIAFPDGSKYRVLVLPNVPTMTPETLACIERMVKAGATVIGNPPVKSPSLVNYPACDAALSSLATKMWGGTQPPATMARIGCGKGVVCWGGNLNADAKEIYPTYAATAALLSSLGLTEDFSSPSGKLRFTHRQTSDHDIYFVSNRTEEKVVTEGVFRIDGSQPQLWDPVTGERHKLADFATKDGTTRVPLCFEPLQSFFVIFPSNNSPKTAATPNYSDFKEVAILDGPWNVSFDPKWGGPANITFDSLTDWITHPEEGIRYYSGTATYRKTFDARGFNLTNKNKIWLSLGTVHEICRVRLNGKDLGIVWTSPWRVNITPALKATGNQLEIEVANGWVNRLIGDQQPAHKGVRKVKLPSGLLAGMEQPAGRHTFITHPHYKAASPLRPAGLIGPVSILTNSP